MKRAIACVLAALVAGAVSVRSQNPVNIAIDVASDRHAIDARIYGLSFADASTVSELRVPINRWGGNATSRYNWQLNASNHASDWFFESLGDPSDVPGASADDFIRETKSGGADPVVTVPILGRVAKLGSNRGTLASFSIAKYGAQTGADPWFPDAGNGIAAASGQAITGNNPDDANMVVDTNFQQGWIRHLTSRWESAAAGGVRYYTLDNEPSLWHVTHRDVHPNGATMDEVRNTFVAHAARIKEADPGALVIGPEEWGWSGYFYSGHDQQWGAKNGFRDFPDRASHNNSDYLPWFLDQLHRSELSTGTRLLDVLSVHYYPQGGEYGDDRSAEMQLRRNRSTRSLWDPDYTDESWIGAAVHLIPRLRTWRENYYPGTRLAISEYNWGAEGDINGATAQADILGIFGREGLDMAARWPAPGVLTPTYKVFKLYRNYDDRGSAFGDVSLAARAPDPDKLSVFAAQRTGDGAVTIMAINKVPGVPTTVNFRLADFNAGTLAQMWQLTSNNVITHGPDVAVSKTTFMVTLPAQSITLFIVPTTAAAGLPASLSIGATSGTPQSAEVNARFVSGLLATVHDRTGAAVSGVPVRFATPTSGAGAEFGGLKETTAVTDTDGIARAPAPTANNQPGSYAVTASILGAAATPAAFDLTNRPGTFAPVAGAWQNVTPKDINLTGSAFDNDNFGILDVLVDPVRPSDFYAFTSHQGVWRSTDFGQTWVKISTGKNGESLVRGKLWTAAIEPNPNRPPSTAPTLWTATGNAAAGVWRSTDGGVNWDAYATNNSQVVSISGSSYFGDDVYALDVDPYDGQHLLAGFHGFPGLSESTDGGRTWRTIGIPERQGSSVYPFFVNTGVPSTTRQTWLTQAQWNTNTEGIWRTNDSGATWRQVAQTLEHKHGSTQIHQVGGGVIYVPSTTPNGVFRSTDYGTTWSQVSSGLVNTVYGTPTTIYSQDCFATTGDYAPNLMFAASPEGNTWSSMPRVPGMQNGAKRVAVSFDGSNYVMVSGNWLSGIWRYIEPRR